MTDAELIQGCRDEIHVLYKSSPKFLRVHYLRAEGPDECTWLLANEMASLVFGFEFDVPEYVPRKMQAGLDNRLFQGHAAVD